MMLTEDQLFPVVMTVLRRELPALLRASGWPVQASAPGSPIFYGRWITIGGALGEDGKKHGGSPVYVEDGRITKGAPTLTGKRLDRMHEVDEGFGVRKAGSIERDYAKASWRKQARAVGISPDALDDLAGDLLAHDAEFHQGRKEMLAEARRELGGHGDVRAVHLQSMHGRDFASIPGIDAVAEHMASRYPHLFPPHADHVHVLGELLTAGAGEPMSAERAYAEAFDHLRSEHERFKVKEDEEVPFSQGIDAVAYWRKGIGPPIRPASHEVPKVDPAEARMRLGRAGDHPAAKPAAPALAGGKPDLAPLFQAPALKKAFGRRFPHPHEVAEHLLNPAADVGRLPREDREAIHHHLHRLPSDHVWRLLHQLHERAPYYHLGPEADARDLVADHIRRRGPGEERPLDQANRHLARAVDLGGMRLQDRFPAEALLRSLPRVPGVAGGVHVPEGVDLARILGPAARVGALDQPQRAGPPAPDSPDQLAPLYDVLEKRKPPAIPDVPGLHPDLLRLHGGHQAELARIEDELARLRRDSSLDEGDLRGEAMKPLLKARKRAVAKHVEAGRLWLLKNHGSTAPHGLNLVEKTHNSLGEPVNRSFLVSRKTAAEGKKAQTFVNALLNRSAAAHASTSIDVELGRSNRLIGAGDPRRGYYHRRRGAVPPRISLPADAPASLAAHELGHHIEAESPAVQRAVQAFAQRRFGNEKPVNMAQKFPHVGFDPTEMGRKDRFDVLFPRKDLDSAYYIGKDYGDGTTEIVSMGLELLHSDPVSFAVKDPDYFHFMLKVLRGDV